jgi:hypothetical protein
MWPWTDADRRRLHSLAIDSERLGGGNNANTRCEDHFLSVAQHNRRLFKDFLGLSVPAGLYSSEIKTTGDLIRVKQPGSSVVSAQIQAILSYVPTRTEKLEDYPIYNKRLLEIEKFCRDRKPSTVCKV